MKERFLSSGTLKTGVKDEFIVALIGFSLLIFGLVQFSSVSSNPVLIQNLTSQGYVGVYLYTAPVFVSSYLLFVVGIFLLLFSGWWRK